MSDKKHIDRVFQEKFKDFEAIPNKKVWDNIQDKLTDSKKKDKQKLIPFWLKLSGVAAILLLLLTLGTLFQSEKKSVEKGKNTIVNTTPPNPNVNTTKVTTKSNDVEFNTNNTVSKKAHQELIQENTTQPNSLNQKQNTSTSFKLASQKPQKTVTEKYTESQIRSPKKTFLPNNNAAMTNSLNNNPLKKQNDSYLKQKISFHTNKQKKDNITVNKTPKTLSPNNSILVDSDTKTDSKKPLIEHDSSTVKRLEKTPSIEEAIVMAEEHKQNHEKEKLVNRWQVSANIAPVYYNSFGDGSHIDQQFIGSSKTGEINTSYGVNVSYAVNKKLNVRTGVSSLKLSYDTNNVILYENVSGTNSASYLRNITLSNGNQSLAALSANNLGVQQVDNGLLPNANAAISQRLSYYEVPVELGYKIVNKKIELQVIGGVSTFFLNDNQVYSEIDDNKSYIGEANNIKDVSFSGNIGLGVDYKFSEKFKFNLEPTFKYQFNAYESTSGNFNPYIIGVYTGFSFRF